jgi:cyanophycinase
MPGHPSVRLVAVLITMISLVQGRVKAQEPRAGDAGPAAPAGAPASGGTLLVVGGGVLPEDVKNRFVALAGGASAKVLVIPASPFGGDPVRSGFALAPWKNMGLGSVELLHARDRAQADDPEFVAPITTASGVWLGGGQQGWLADIYAGTELERQLHALLGRGGVIGGTSAGAAVMSRVMIAGGRDHPIEGRGFDLLPDVVIDQHFLRRSRMNRLLELLERYPDHVGIGIDEGTALEIPLPDRRARVLGASYVVACKPSGPGLPTRLNVLKAGDFLQLPALPSPMVAEGAAAAGGGGGK